MTTERRHGGPDHRGAAPWDFSTCANAAGPCPTAIERLRRANPTRYPDPNHAALRERLARWHGVAPERVRLAASASEFIQRITAVGARLLPGPVALPPQAYSDYRQAAAAWQRPWQIDEQAGAPIERRRSDETPCSPGPPGPPPPTPTLRWFAEPSSPLGADAAPPGDAAACPGVLDAVYAPLRLTGTPHWSQRDRDSVFVLHSPNKALGLCGVRGAYAIAPLAGDWDVAGWCAALDAAAPSWPLGAHGVALLEAWCDPAAQHWLAQSRVLLAEWKAALIRALAERGFACHDSRTPFFCARPPEGHRAEALRRHGVAVRDTASFSLPGHWRLSAQAPAAVAALTGALDAEWPRR